MKGKNIDLFWTERDFKGFISKESAAGNSKKKPLFMLDFLLYFGDTYIVKNCGIKKTEPKVEKE